MAIIDTEKNIVVIRIVFDGSPLSGKTTTIYALRDALSPTSTVFPPQGDTDTTLYFDWLEYTGGQFQQMPITCQIVSTPSQADLHVRREYLLNTADVVIFVVDAAESDQQTALGYYADVQAIQANQHFKTLILANKQDKKDSTIELAHLYDDSIKIIQASALKNRGIREAFVSAVRLATERLQALLNENKYLNQQPQEKTPEQLLATLQQLEDIDLSASQLEALADLSEEPFLDEKPHAADLTSNQLEALADLDDDEILTDLTSIEQQTDSTPPVDESTEPTVDLDERLANIVDEPIETLPNVEQVAEYPAFPSEQTPFKWIYPPILGRNILKKADFQHGLQPTLADKTWVIDLDGQWRCFSKWQYSSEEAARLALREQIAWHVQCNPLLMKQRCVAIAQEHNTWRLWQITQTPTHLAQQLIEALSFTDINQLVVETFTCATAYLDAYQELTQLPFEFQLQLNNVDVHDNHIAYLGAIDGQKSQPVDSYLGSNDAIKDILKQEFMPILQQAVHSEDLDIEAIVCELEAVQTQDDDLIIVEALSELFVEAM